MIKITKSNQVPDILAGDKAATAKQDIANKVAAGTEIESKDFDGNVYNGKGVKMQLLEDQKQKCAFCEVSMAGDYGAVEHYRPKTAWKEDNNDFQHNPGYHWLAYDWTNMLCSCDKCNSAARKGNLFPLRDPNTRDIQHQKIEQEVPLIINPSSEEPGNYIRFHQYMAVPVLNNGIESDKGRRTIDIFDLNGCIPTKTAGPRTDLKELRKTIWNYAKALYDSKIEQGLSKEDAIEEVKKVYAQPDRPFAGMFMHQDFWF